MNLARQELPGKGGSRYRVPEGRLKALRFMIQSSLQMTTLKTHLSQKTMAIW